MSAEEVDLCKNCNTMKHLNSDGLCGRCVPEEVELDELIKAMVNRFLAWKIPEDFMPDAGISYDSSKHHPNHPPVGTNLFTATQAEAMIRHMLGTNLLHWREAYADKARIDELHNLAQGGIEFSKKTGNLQASYAHIRDLIQARLSALRKVNEESEPKAEDKES